MQTHVSGTCVRGYVGERVGIEKFTDAATEAAQEETGRRRPMANEKRRLIDNRKADPTL